MTSATLEQLENDDWGEPEFGSHLVTECHRLRRKPIDEFTVEEHRLMIGQNIGLAFLLPAALGHLNTDPLAAGDFYAGDLLRAVISCDMVQETRDETLIQDLVALCRQALAQLPAQAAEELSGGFPHEETGLDPAELQRRVEERAATLRGEVPWCDMSAFVAAHEPHE